MRIAHTLVLALVGVLPACAPTPAEIRATPDDTWTWQVNRNYQGFAHCLTDALNSAPEHSWFYQAPRPVTSFEQQWLRKRIILKSVDPANVEQVRIDVDGVSDHITRVIAVAKNLEILGGGAPMSFVRYYVGGCSQG
jgi:hypothetical protein